MTKTKKILVGAGTVIVVLAAFILTQPEPPLVEVELIEKRSFILTVEDQGKTRALNPYIVAAPVAGLLLRSELNEGDAVNAGQTIAQIALSPLDQRTLAIERANLSAAEASLRVQQSILVEAQGVHARSSRELERREELLKINLASVEEVEVYRQAIIAAEANVESSQAAVDAAMANVESVRSRLLGSTSSASSSYDAGSIEEVLAPTDGTVLKVLEESERVVLAGTPLFEISNQDRLEVVVDLLTQDAVKVESGDSVRIFGWGGDEEIQGTVRYIEPEAFTKFSALGVEEQRVNVIIDLANPPPNIGAEYRVEVAVVISELDSVLTVPASSLFQRAGDWHVFVVNDQQVELRAIEIANRNREYAQLVSGLEEGEVVILYPSDLIEEGLTVSYE